MDYVLGHFKNGQIVLDEQPDWPVDQRVAVLPHLDGEPVGTVQPRVELPDGRVVPFNGTPEHFKLLAERMDRHEPVEMTDGERADFQKSLAEVNQRYGRALRRLADGDGIG